MSLFYLNKVCTPYICYESLSVSWAATGVQYNVAVGTLYQCNYDNEAIDYINTAVDFSSYR